MRVASPRGSANVLKLACAVVLLVCVVALWVYLRYVGPLPGDEAILQHVSQRQELRTSHLLQFFGTLGTTGVALLTVLIAATLIRRAIGTLAAATVLFAALGVLVNQAIRTLLGPTPGSQAAFGPFVESYPSGHVVYATAVFGILAWLAWTHGRRDAAAVLMCLIVSMGIARVLSSAHLTSDVIGGYLLGGAWLLITLAAYDGMHARRDPQSRLG